MQEYHIVFNPEKCENFFRELSSLIKGFKRDIDIYIKDEAMEKLKTIERKRYFSNDEIEKLTIKIKNADKTTVIDIIIDKKTRQVKELGFGPINQKRKVYHPFKTKKAKRKVIIV